MKRWTLGGLTLIVVGVAALTLRFGCQFELKIEDVTPLEHRMGWREDLANSEATRQLVAQMPPFEIEGIKRDNRRANVRLWKYSQEVNGGEHLPNYRQQVGDCVSFGAKNAGNYLQCVQIALGQRAEFKELYPPYIYGTSRVQVGGGRLSGDGSVGAWAAKAVQVYGVLAADADDVPPYSGTIARQWGSRGPPEKFIKVAQETLVKTVSQVKSAQQVCDAICNGYPCTIASNFGSTNITKRDGRMVARWNASWAHQMAIIAYDGSSESGERYFYVLNSWGKDAHPAPIQGEPPGGFWITWADCDRICQQGDSFAFSSFQGFPARELDFNIFHGGEQVAVAFTGKDFAVMVLMIGGAVATLCLFIFGIRRYRTGLAALAICAVVTSASAQDFSVLETPPINFDVLNEVDSDKVSFAVLDVCNCEETGICLCENCKCENCPNKKASPNKAKAENDDRPVITVRTMPNCPPCAKCKADSKTDALKGFRFLFIQQETVVGGAPRIEWQGLREKWAINGWRGPESFKDLYDKSMRGSAPAVRIPQPIIHHQSYAVPAPRAYPPACSGGACRIFR